MTHALISFVALATDLDHDDQWSPALVRRADKLAERQRRNPRKQQDR